MRSKKIKIFLFSLILVFSFSFTGQKANAEAWGTNVGSALMKDMLDRMYDKIQGMMLQVSKQASSEVMHSSVGNLVSRGNDGNPLYITDWDNFLIEEPLEKSALYMNDFFTLTTRGRASSGNYVPYSSSGSSGARVSYDSYLVGQAKESIFGSNIYQTDLNQYTSDPSQMLASGNWRAYNAFISNPANNPFGYNLMAEDAYLGQLENERRKAEVKAIAYQGYREESNNGQVVTPGSIVKDLVSQDMEFTNNLISGATHPEEVITATLTRMVTNSIKQGMGTVQRDINRELRQIENYTRTVDRKIENSIEDAFEPLY